MTASDCPHNTPFGVSQNEVFSIAVKEGSLARSDRDATSTAAGKCKETPRAVKGDRHDVHPDDAAPFTATVILHSALRIEVESGTHLH